LTLYRYSRVRQVELGGNGGGDGGGSGAGGSGAAPPSWRVNEPARGDFFPVDVISPKLRDAMIASSDPTTPMRVIRSDAYDCVLMPVRLVALFTLCF
jgi:hypothetical protein